MRDPLHWLILIVVVVGFLLAVRAAFYFIIRTEDPRCPALNMTHKNAPDQLCRCVLVKGHDGLHACKHARPPKSEGDQR